MFKALGSALLSLQLSETNQAPGLFNTRAFARAALRGGKFDFMEVSIVAFVIAFLVRLTAVAAEPSFSTGFL